jgi:general secretion pathway protein M
MALVAEQGNNRLAAVLLFVIVVIVVYLVCFHWFILRHVEYSSEISDLSEQLGRYERVAAQKELYDSMLQGLENRKSDENLFVEGGDFNEAAAEMSERLGQMIDIQAEDSCQIVSRQPVRPRVQERFEKVTVNVRMRCGIDDFEKVLYALETSVPMVIADEVTVIKPRSRRRANRKATSSNPTLDIRFNMSGYLRRGSQP